jgi:outer membrane protein OmpA-like peptidoglycan-associated protein
LAELTRAEHYSTETLYGYTSDTGSARTQMVVSDLRANAVATYLRQQLAALHVTGVKVISVGEGAVKAETAATYRRVEVFVKA